VDATPLTFQRLGGDFAFSNFNNFANTWGQNVIECPKDGADPVPLSFALGRLPRELASCTLTTLRAPSLTAYNTPAERCVVTRDNATLAVPANNVPYEVVAPPNALLHAVLE